ncbi:MAG: histidine phosphatase family protein [Actinobacteria bacterium]|nr:histidine phosphatase family protein [Actinomycetota bacterium]
MIQLTLTRHAKSDWGDPGVEDHERPLNARGLRDAPVMAHRFAESGGQVQRLISSSAVRARSTAAVFGAELGVEVELDDALYLAPASRLLATAAETGADSVMIVAHDPGITELAALLSRGGISHMPTCAVARFTWQLDSWNDAVSHVADSWRLDTPR